MRRHLLFYVIGFFAAFAWGACLPEKIALVRPGVDFEQERAEHYSGYFYGTIDYRAPHSRLCNHGDDIWMSDISGVYKMTLEENQIQVGDLLDVPGEVLTIGCHESQLYASTEAGLTYIYDLSIDPPLLVQIVEGMSFSKLLFSDTSVLAADFYANSGWEGDYLILYSWGSGELGYEDYVTIPAGFKVLDLSPNDYLYVAPDEFLVSGGIFARNIWETSVQRDGGLYYVTLDQLEGQVTEAKRMGDLLVVVTEDGWFGVYDLSVDDLAPLFLGSVQMDSFYKQPEVMIIDIDQSEIMITDGGGMCHVVDVSNPQLPEVITSFTDSLFSFMDPNTAVLDYPGFALQDDLLLHLHKQDLTLIDLSASMSHHLEILDEVHVPRFYYPDEIASNGDRFYEWVAPLGSIYEYLVDPTETGMPIQFMNTIEAPDCFFENYVNRKECRMFVEKDSAIAIFYEDFAVFMDYAGSGFCYEV